MTSFQFATRITNAILSGQTHVNFCNRIMCRFNLFAIIRTRFKPLARRNLLRKTYFTSSKLTLRTFLGQCQIELILIFDPCLKDFDQKIVWDLHIPYGSSQFQLGKRVSNYRWQFSEQGFFMQFILAFSKHLHKIRLKNFQYLELLLILSLK